MPTMTQTSQSVSHRKGFCPKAMPTVFGHSKENSQYQLLLQPCNKIPDQVPRIMKKNPTWFLQSIRMCNTQCGLKLGCGKIWC